MVDINNLITRSLDDLDNDVSLSVIINRCLRIAYAVDDPAMVYALKIENSSYDNERRLQQNRAEFSESMMRKYNNHEEAKQMHLKILKEYFYRRSIREMKNEGGIEDKGKIKGNSITEIENEISTKKLYLERNEIPEGLHSLDLYFEKQSKDKIDSILIFHIGELENIRTKVKDFLYSFLVDLEGRGLKGGQNHMGISREMNKKVFIIHGHDEAKRRELESLLSNDFGLEPIILSDQPDRGSSTIIDKFEFYARDCSFAIALFTPDDVVENNGKKYFQARPNVLYELGWFSSYLSRERVLLLLKEGPEMEVFSDFSGVLQKRFRSDISEQYKNIKSELEYVGMI